MNQWLYDNITVYCAKCLGAVYFSYFECHLYFEMDDYDYGQLYCAKCLGVVYLSYFECCLYFEMDDYDY